MGLCSKNKRSIKEEGLAFIESNNTEKDGIFSFKVVII